MAPLQVNLDQRFGFMSPHSMQVYLHIGRVKST
jgi:hypothetical protein